ncbi:hypothetical protein [Arenimonas donghaensis]|uniref:Uncharacterized protein n=1 Tax=Arenimonas donghaensis DSM 18148 = HO3-R19 TaxID=1121014 RepID=A0A087MFU1_9GAMM|nr:hypothetical protein [Arenimonas donghaensis]KFL35744.1 hypothetical protein N788_07455 [Arenimonas donghaensis DSM 18148 = HO3-R19]
MPLLRTLALAAGLLALAAGMVVYPFDYRDLAPRLQDSLVLALLAGGLAGLLAWRLRIRAASAVLLASLPVAGVALAGLPDAAAMTLLLLGAVAMGTLLPPVAGTSPLLRVVAGLGLLAGVAGWLLPFPVHHAGSWALALAILLLWRRRQVKHDLQALASEFRQGVDEAPGTAFAVCLLAFVVSAPAWLPVQMADDIAYHLGLVWELMQFGHARFDVGTQVWALAPWSTDVLHALVSLLAGDESTSFLNCAWLLMAAWLVRGLARSLGLSPRLSWLAAAAYLSLPMSYMLVGSLQVESATPAMMACVASLLVARVPPGRAPLWLLATLAGTLMGSKVSNGLLLLPFFVWWLLQWRAALPWRDLPVAIGLGVLAGGSSYAYAWGLAGNPVLPLMNAYFGSPWFLPENFIDPTWTSGLGWDLPWRWVFQTPTFHEGGRIGAAGVLPIALLGGLLLAVQPLRSRALALATLASAALLLSQIQYLRYLHPLMPMMAVLMLAGLAGTPAAGRERLLAGVMTTLVAIQVLLLPTSSWLLMTREIRVLATQGRDAVLVRTVPERLLARHFRNTAEPGDFLLYAHSTNAVMAELPRQSAAVSWHSQFIWDIRLQGWDWPAMLEASGATHLVVRHPEELPGLASVLEQASVVTRAGPATLYRLAPAILTPRSLPAAKGEIALALPLAATHASTGWLELQLACTPDMSAVSLAWELDRPGRPAIQRWTQAPCQDGTAQARMYFAALAGADSLRVGARALPEGQGLPVALRHARANLRRDPTAETERFHMIWDAVCARPGCGRDRSWLRVDRWDAVRD